MELMRKDDAEELEELKKNGKVKTMFDNIQTITGEIEEIANRLEDKSKLGEKEEEEEEITVEMIRKAMGRA